MSLESIVQSCKNLGKKLKKRAPKDITNSTFLLMVATPVQALNDTFGMEWYGQFREWYDGVPNDIISMTNETSINGKIGVAAITYAFAGPLYQICRGASERKFGIKQKTSEWIHGLHDFVFTAFYSTTVVFGGYALGYIFTGKYDKESVNLALTISAISQLWRGPMIGYSVDCGQDLLGYKECDRATYPDLVKNLNNKWKRVVAAGALAASLAVTVGIYSLTPKSWSDPNRLSERKQQIEQLERTPYDQQNKSRLYQD